MFKNLVGVADVNFEKVNGRNLRNYKADLIAKTQVPTFNNRMSCLKLQPIPS